MRHFTLIKVAYGGNAPPIEVIVKTNKPLSELLKTLDESRAPAPEASSGGWIKSTPVMPFAYSAMDIKKAKVIERTEDEKTWEVDFRAMTIIREIPESELKIIFGRIKKQNEEESRAKTDTARNFLGVR